MAFILKSSLIQLKERAMIKNILLLCTTIFLFSGCFGEEKQQEWTSWVYPDKNNIKRSLKGKTFKTLEECREASLAKLQELDVEAGGDYNCGLNCNYHEGMKTEICEKMTK